MDAREWLTNQLEREGPALWTEQERRGARAGLGSGLPAGGRAMAYQGIRGKKEGASPVYVVTHGGAFGIHSLEGKEAHDKAQAIMRALNALDREMSELGKSG